MPRRSREELWTYLHWVAERERQKQAPAEMAVLDGLIALGFKWQVPRIWETKNGGYGGAAFDFFHGDAELAVEIDDPSHKQRKGRDRRRDTRFAVEDIRTLRFSNREALKNTAAVIEQVKQEMER